MRSRRILRTAALGAAACAAAALALPAVPVGASTHASSQFTKHSYILLLRTPSRTIATVSRRDAVRASQDGVNARLASLDVKAVARTLVPDTVTANLTSSQLASLRSAPGVVSIFRDVLIPAPTLPTTPFHATVVTHGASKASISADGISSLCGTAAHPQLNPEALRAINAGPAIRSGADGAGVKVAFIADGIDTTLPDFQRSAKFASAGNPAGSPVITDYEDFSTDGTAAPTPGGEAFLDASSIVAQGNSVYDLSTFNPAHPLPTGCDIKVQGDAPGVDLEALKVFSSRGFTTESAFLQAIDYAVATNVKVLNESFGGNPFPDAALDLTRLADEAAVAAGVTVVASTGDAGTDSTIGSPSTDPAVIAVGASTTFRAYQQFTYGGINVPGIGNGRVLDDNISSISSGGFAQDGKTVDLVAPGDSNWALCSTSATYADCGGKSLEFTGGTSESSPLTAGAAADVIEAYAQTHHGVDPSPALVKHILTSSATDVFAPGNEQGAGLLNIGAAVSLARSIAGTTSHDVDGGLLASTSQLDLSGQPGSKASGTVAVTNTSHHTQVVFASARELFTAGSTSGTITLDPSTTTTQPTFPIWSGAKEIYQTATFKVPAHTDRLQFNAAYTYTGQSSLLHVALFTPDGTYAGYSLPQGLGDYSNIEVTAPQRGTWTAVFFTVADADGLGNGTSGAVPWTASFQNYQTVGDTDPGRLEIPAGATRNVTLSLHTGANPGDSDYSLVLGDSGVTIPVTLRTFIPTNSVTGGTFQGTLFGGNGRSAPAQTNTWQFNVPAGEQDLDASLVMSANGPAGGLPADQFIAYLIDPNGQIAAMDTNYTQGTSGQEFNPYVQLYAAQPASGTWSMVVDWVQPLTGAATSVPFSGAVRFDLVSAGSNLPDSASTDVSASSGGTYSVTVHNTGVAPMSLTTDARLNSSATYALSDVFGASATQALPGGNNTYFVPTGTSSLSISETATVAPTFDVSTYTGDPDISPQIGGPGVTSSLSPTTASITFTPGTQVSPGLWFDADAEIGPYASTAPAGSETTTASVTTAAFDPAVSSTTGDLVSTLTVGSPGFAPDVIEPGQTATISVAISPTASVGTTVSGNLYIDGLTYGAFFGNETLAGSPPLFPSSIAALPYEYTVTS